MVLKLTPGLKNPGKPFPFSGAVDLDPAQLGEDVLSIEPVSVEGEFSGITTDAARLNGKIRARLTARCAKCLEESAFDLDLNLKETVVREGSVDSEQEEAEEHFTFTGDALDMDEIIRTYVLLALPMRFVCRTGCRQESIQEMDAAAAKAAKDISPFAVLLENMEEV